MNRRSFLGSIAPAKVDQNTDLIDMNSGLDPYVGEWTLHQARHLLRRTVYGVNKELAQEALDMGLENTLDLLLQDMDAPEPPIYFDFDGDPQAGMGQSWVDSHYDLSGEIVEIVLARFRSLASWHMLQSLGEGISIREKMTLFWQNHFVVSGTEDPVFVYDYLKMLRNFSLGNFREMTKAVTVSGAMLRYLNGNENVASAPNENYARELLELFTIGKGPQIGPGDYTHYTEEDVIAVAKVLTGWVDRGHFSIFSSVVAGSTFVAENHDASSKQLSEKFDSAMIANAGADEYANLIDIIFEQNEVARFICRKLYRYFVYYDIDSDVENNVIAPMAQILIAHDYEIKPALRALLSSEHFFDEALEGGMIKNPLDFLLGVLKGQKIDFGDNNFEVDYQIGLEVSSFMTDLEMPIFYFPSVAGYPAYYQEPGFYRLWTNSVTLPLRGLVTTVLSIQGAEVGGVSIIIDVLTLVQELDNPSDPNTLIVELADTYFPKGIEPNQLTYLKTFLIGGLPDFEWTVEYGNWAADPEGSGLQTSIEIKLRALWYNLLIMPEYTLS